MIIQAVYIEPTAHHVECFSLDFEDAAFVSSCFNNLRFVLIDISMRKETVGRLMCENMNSTVT